jgi:hypothetical protein
VHVDRLVELTGAEATIAVRRGELDLHVGRDLWDEVLFLENDIGRLVSRPVVTARDLENEAATEVRGPEKPTGALAERRRNQRAVDPLYFMLVLWFRTCHRLRRC